MASAGGSACMASAGPASSHQRRQWPAGGNSARTPLTGRGCAVPAFVVVLVPGAALTAGLLRRRSRRHGATGAPPSAVAYNDPVADRAKAGVLSPRPA